MSQEKEKSVEDIIQRKIQEERWQDEKEDDEDGLHGNQSIGFPDDDDWF